MCLLFADDLQKLKYDRYPELYNNLELVIEFLATQNKPDGYSDTSSILLAFLFELTAVFGSKEMFEEILKHTDESLSLQIPDINFEEYDVESLLFEKNLNSEYHVETIERVPKVSHIGKKALTLIYLENQLLKK